MLSGLRTLANLSNLAKRSLRILTSSSGSHVVERAVSRESRNIVEMETRNGDGKNITCESFDVGEENGDFFVSVNVNLVKLVRLKVSVGALLFLRNVADHLLRHEARQY